MFEMIYIKCVSADDSFSR